jgi:hypothetical protein
VLDVGQQQLLVLLLVVQAQRDQRLHLGIARAGLEQGQHRVVDVGSVALHVDERRPRDQASAGARMLLSHTLVVAVEENPEGRIERLVGGRVALEQEGLEEPGDVGEVPLGRARVGHRLHLAVLGRERRRKVEARLTDRGVAPAQRTFEPGGDARARRLGMHVVEHVSSSPLRLARCVPEPLRAP